MACLPACYPSTIAYDFDYNMCEADLLKLLKCGTGKMTSQCGNSDNTLNNYIPNIYGP